jgi:hypothetical protein
MGSVGLEASLPRPPWRKLPLYINMSRAASSAPVPQTISITTILWLAPARIRSNANEIFDIPCSSFYSNQIFLAALFFG